MTVYRKMRPSMIVCIDSLEALGQCEGLWKSKEQINISLGAGMRLLLCLN